MRTPAVPSSEPLLSNFWPPLPRHGSQWIILIVCDPFENQSRILNPFLHSHRLLSTDG